MRSLFIIFIGILSINSYAQINSPISQFFEVQCMECHSYAATNAPLIAGQKVEFLEFELFNFRDDIRTHEIMYQVMEDFTDQEVKDLAAHISSLPLFEAEVVTHPNANVANGEQIFNRSCFQCHQKDNTAIGPVIHGQRTEYLENAIKSFQSTWYAPRPSRVNMRSQTDMLTEQDIIDVSAYLNEN